MPPPALRDRWRRLRMALSLALVVLAVTSCAIPKDPENTFDDASGDVLHVGVAHDPPWGVLDDGEVVGGVDVALAAAFAESIGAELALHAGTLDDLGEALSRFELHLLVGGLTKSSAWAGPLALSPEYYTEEVVAAGDAVAADLDGLRGQVVLYPLEEPQLASRIRSEEGIPKPVAGLLAADDLREVVAGGDVLVALPRWRVEQLELDPVGVRLAERNHVLAVPRGENEMLLQVAEFLDDERAEVEALLQATVEDVE